MPKDKLQNKVLETITLKEAVERIEYLCDIEVPQKFKNSIYLINKYRNDITHHSIKLSPAEEHELVKELQILSVNIITFFSEHIPDIYEQIYTARFEVTQEEVSQWEKDMADFNYDRTMSRLSIDEDEL